MISIKEASGNYLFDASHQIYMQTLRAQRTRLQGDNFAEVAFILAALGEAKGLLG